MASSNSNSSPPSDQESSTNSIHSWILGLVSAEDPTPREVTVLLNQLSGSIEVIEGPLYVEPLLRQPASRASIESLPRVEVSDPGLECPICLSGYDVEGEREAKMMPCEHLFHSGCIDEWLEIRGSCPVCRFNLPVEEEEEEERANVEREGEGDEDEEGEGWRIHVVLARAIPGLDTGLESGWDSDSEGGDDEEESDEGNGELAGPPMHVESSE